MSDDRYAVLDALEARGDQLMRFADIERQANEYIAREGTQKLVNELRAGLADKRSIRLGTVNTLVLMTHIDKLEAEVSKAPLVKP